jgi:hypothetical protein
MKSTWLNTLIVFALMVGFLALVQFSTPNLADHDGYYHIKMAYLMRTQGIKLPFPWLPLTVLNPREFVDHHFLFHIALIPFTFGDLRLGAKLAAVIFPALAFLAIWWLLRGQKVPWASLWALGLLAISEAFIYRMSMPRAQSLSLGVLALAVHWLLTGHHRRLLPLAFLYVWLYNAFPLILLVTLAWAAAAWLAEGHLYWKPLLFAGLGVLLGLLINPYFPDNLIFLARHVLPKVTDPVATRVGSEWFPYDTMQLIENSGFALLTFLGGMLAMGLAGKRATTPVITAFALAVGFGVMLFQSRRFIEYAPAFALIFAALSVSAMLSGWLAGAESASGPARLADWVIGKVTLGRKRLLSRQSILTAAMFIILIPVLALNLKTSRQSFADTTRPYLTYAAASAWLEANTAAGERIFQTDWDDFPRLFFYNSHNTYTLGLDPTYMQLYNSDLYDLWVDITIGNVKNPSNTIRQQFGSRYVLTDLHHDDFMRQANNDPNMQEVYRDDYAAIYEIIATR